MEIKEIIEGCQSQGYTLTDLSNISKKLKRPIALSTLSTLVNNKRHGSFKSYQSVVDIRDYINKITGDKSK